MILNELRSLSWLAALLLLEIPCQGQTPRPESNTGTGFYVVGREVFNPDGTPFQIRGFSHVHGWGDTSFAERAIVQFPKARPNAVRLVCGANSPSERQRLVEEYLALGIVPIVEDHCATGSVDPAVLEKVIVRWLDPANVQWLKQYEKYVILNIANEWGPYSTVWRDAYISAVTRIRAAGINCLLMIDAGGHGGQDPRSIQTWGTDIENADPQHNIVFSLHMYGYWVTGDKPGLVFPPGSMGGVTPWDINAELDKIAQLNLPLVVGEFSWQRGDVSYNTRTAMKLFTQHQDGWLAWSWNGNFGLPYNLVLKDGWENEAYKYKSDASLSEFGDLIINDPDFGLKVSAKQSTVFGGMASATFVGNDVNTQGSWKSHYGDSGYVIVGDQTSIPDTAVMLGTGNSGLRWTNSTDDLRGLQKAAPGSSDKIAACWYAPKSFVLDLAFVDGLSHPVSIYCLDWENKGLSQRIDVVDAVSGAVLDSQTLTQFTGGTYLTWNLKGHVQLRFTRVSGDKVVLSGFFFNSQTVSDAKLVSTNTTLHGNWKHNYGSDGYDIIGDQTDWPIYASVTSNGQSCCEWTNSTTDTRALERRVLGAPNRNAAFWHAPDQFSVDINLTDGQWHGVTIYCVDFDKQSRSERIDVVDAISGTVLDSQTLTQFTDGTYLTWNLKGHVQLRFTRLSGVNAVVSGIFFDIPIPTSSVSSSATFISSDTTTQGNSQGRYGTDGYNIIGNQAKLPTYATVTPVGPGTWTWATSTTDIRALQKGGTSVADRIASCWYHPGQFLVDINLTDDQSHTVSIYAVDWDSNNRSERVDVVDLRNGSVLDSQTLSSFHGGTYLTWTLKGHVQLRFTNLRGANAVVSGIFFGNPT